MNKIIQWIIGVVAVIALILSISALVGGNQSADQVGASGTRFPNGISANSTSPTAGQVLGTTLLTSAGGTLNQQTSNTSTSTARLGCIQVNATSTDTNIVLGFTSSFTSTTTYPTGTNVDVATGGLVAWNFGSCPL